MPGWLKNGLSAKGDAIVLAGDPKPPSDKIWLFDESFAKAFKAGDWQITTAKATITVTRDKDDNLSWQQVVAPDLAAGEQLGHWMKAGPGEIEFSGDPPLDSQLGEVVYGWTVPASATPSPRRQLDLVVIVTEIEVTNPAGAKRTFKPSPRQIAEAIIHEIGVHAGRIAAGPARLTRRQRGDPGDLRPDRRGSGRTADGPRLELVDLQGHPHVRHPSRIVEVEPGPDAKLAGPMFEERAERT